IAEDPMPLAQCPIDRSPAIQPDIEPFVKPAHQGRAELGPLAGFTRVAHQPAAAAPPAQRLVFERGTALACGHRWADQRLKSAKAVVGEPQGAVLDVEHQPAGDVADRKQHTLVGSAMPEAGGDLEITVADQRRYYTAVHCLPIRQKSPPALDRR